MRAGLILESVVMVVKRLRLTWSGFAIGVGRGNRYSEGKLTRVANLLYVIFPRASVGPATERN